MKAVIPAAGLGTRLLPATKAQPKEMLPVVDKPAIQYVVEEAVASGIRDILIITGRGKRAIEDHFDKSVELEYILEKKGKSQELSQIKPISDMANIFYIRQKEQLGLGHAILCAKEHINNEAFAVMLGDDLIIGEPPVIQQLVNVFKRKKASVIAVEPGPADRVHRYGIIKGKEVEDNLFQIEDIIEKPSRSTESVYAYQFSGTRYDIGSKEDLVKATIGLALTRDDMKDSIREYVKGIL
ncbi:MAG: UTP--glucose-1-phosphate uridylyltransferase [Candidatus Thorarchaeota archaeon]|jgi:UTP--glucose-1-phosphate uridylyltransferase